MRIALYLYKYILVHSIYAFHNKKTKEKKEKPSPYPYLSHEFCLSVSSNQPSSIFFHLIFLHSQIRTNTTEKNSP